MKFMYTWSAKEGAIPDIVDLSGGFTLVETNDLVLPYRHACRWATALEFKVSPVIEDQEAAPILKEVFGK